MYSKKNIILIGSEGKIGSCIKNHLLKNNANLICVDILEKKKKL